MNTPIGNRNPYNHSSYFCFFLIKGALSGLRQYFATERPLKMMKNAFYFTLKAKVNFKIHDVTLWLTNDYNTYIAQYLIK